MIRKTMQQEDWRRREGVEDPGVPRSRALGAAVLAAAILTLVALAGPHLIEHLISVGEDPDQCAACTGIHGARDGVPTTIVAPAHTLLVVGFLTVQRQASVPFIAIPIPASRAPPIIG